MRPKILFVEDDEDDEYLVGEGFNKLGFTQFFFCKNAVDALKHLEGLHDDDLPTLIVSEYDLPALTGLHFVEQVKELDRYAAIPFVIYSRPMEDELKEELFAAGVLEVIEKQDDMEAFGYQLIRFIELA